MKKRILYRKRWETGIAFFLVILLQTACQTSPESNDEADDPWNQVQAIAEQIEVPAFPDQDFRVTDFGAKGDGATDCLPAVKQAIETCHSHGGGRVIIPEGDFWVKGPIHLRSNVNLYIAEGATVKFGTDPEDYPLVFTRWEGMECMNYSPLIYAFEQENIAITGAGTLDGQADNRHWWPWSGKERYGWEAGMPRQQDSLNRPDLCRQNTAEVPAKERVFGEGHYLRPNFIQPYRCKNILIEGITVKNSPMWALHPVLCENITIQKVRVISHGPNSDGCDPEACRNVLIRECYFDTGDDCIAFKIMIDGYSADHPVRNVKIKNCEFNGVARGNDINHVENLMLENVKINGKFLTEAFH